jgi:RHS repeat-associated protein
LDLSGSLQGAGGIGGLLARSDHTATVPAYAVSYYQADGVGNIASLINSNGIMVARYSYDPYGNVLGQEGPLASANTYRFSSKEFHKTSGLYYYGYRFYHPNLQRWLNADPIGEQGGINLYGFVGNSPLNALDLYGLKSFAEHAEEVGQGIYDMMMNGADGNREWHPNADASAQMLANELGGIHPNNNVLRDSVGFAGREAAVAAKELAMQLAFDRAFELAHLPFAGMVKFCKNAKKVAPGATVLGKFPDYIKLADKLNAKRFDIPTAIWNKMSKAEQWAANQKFLERAIARGDDIILSNPVKNINDVTGAFRKELDYLISKGFKLTTDGSRLVK